MSKAALREEIATRWLLRQSEPDWTDADATELAAWLEAEPENKVTFWRMEMGWQELGRMAALRVPTPPSRVPVENFFEGEFEEGRGLLRRWWPAGVTALAASIALVLAVPQFLQPKAPTAGPAIASYATEVGGRETIPLADGTKVELNTASKLRAAVAANSREVWLDDGEAYFEVAHDPKHPFIVHAGPKTVTVLGTKFTVRRNGDNIEVTVVEGRVRVSGSGPAAAATSAPVLTRGAVLTAQGDSTLVATKTATDLTDRLAWRQGMLSFDQIPLGQAAGEFNRYNRRKLVVTGNAAGMRIEGSFRAENVEAFAKLLERAYGLRVEVGTDVIRISD